jgi:hypothetical protein
MPTTGMIANPNRIAMLPFASMQKRRNIENTRMKRLHGSSAASVKRAPCLNLASIGDFHGLHLSIEAEG